VRWRSGESPFSGGILSPHSRVRFETGGEKQYARSRKLSVFRKKKYYRQKVLEKKTHGWEALSGGKKSIASEGDSFFSEKADPEGEKGERANGEGELQEEEKVVTNL